ncbi:hypothetical protein LSUE1_G005566 [Lachnellula suecica]|uniref:Uncharacterized protein n=1 Tax=Lachnellula suecica TaxID=602035 RepID=A0A8T9C6T2_9HELO|nr:hypothetical protein LSUE1_G005566 [Lachnellula suecica]
MQAEGIDLFWPEYDILEKLKAQKFTLAGTHMAELEHRYLEFDRTSGPLLDVINLIESGPSPMQSTVSVAKSTPSQVIDPLATVEIQSHNSPLTLNSKSLEEGAGTPAWQDTDPLANRAIPLYNFFREFFHNNPPTVPQISYSKRLYRHFITFPTARGSTGPIMRDCVFCYIKQQHCQYHAVPDQPPFEPNVHGTLEDENLAETNVTALQAQFEDLSYVDMREAGLMCKE